MTERSAPRLERWLTAGVFLFFAVAIPYTALNTPIQLAGTSTGLVQSTRGLQGDTIPTSQVLTIRLPSGEVLLAQTLPGVIANEGDTAHFRSYKKRFSGALSHQVYRVD